MLNTDKYRQSQNSCPKLTTPPLLQFQRAQARPESTSSLSRHKVLIRSALLPKCAPSNLIYMRTVLLTGPRILTQSFESISFQNYGQIRYVFPTVHSFFSFYLSVALTSFSKTFLLYFILYFSPNWPFT